MNPDCLGTPSREFSLSWKEVRKEANPIPFGPFIRRIVEHTGWNTEGSYSGEAIT